METDDCPTLDLCPEAESVGDEERDQLLAAQCEV